MDNLTRDGVRFVPIAHGRAEFAVEVVRACDDFKPDAVAVEMPATLEKLLARAVERLPLLSIIRLGTAPGPFGYVPIEPCDAAVEAMRRAIELGIPWHAVDLDVDAYPRLRETIPDPYVIARSGFSAYLRGYYDSGWADLQRMVESAEVDRARERYIAYRLQQLREKHERVLCVLGMAHFPGVLAALATPQARPLTRTQKRDDAAVFHLHEDSSREVTAEPGYVAATFEALRKIPGALTTPGGFDRSRIYLRLAREAATRYQREDGEKLPPHALEVMFQFARNQALLERQVAPDFYTLLVSARGAADDNFAWWVWEMGTHYPWQTDAPEFDVLRVTIEELYDNARYMRFRRKAKKRQRSLLRLVRDRKKPKPGERFALDPDGLWPCSYPPEDVALEHFSARVGHKAQSLLTAEAQRVTPFIASLLDGVDVRETTRNWHERRLYVKDEGRATGDVGSVIVVFNDEANPFAAGSAIAPSLGISAEDERYPWLMTWQGEHESEGDLACFATDPHGHAIGPGIGRAEYGGFLLSWPPGRMFDIWNDADFLTLPLKSEVLLWAGIEYAQERLVVFAAKKPPRPRWYNIAARYGHKLVYVPLGQLSPQTIKKLRVFHVLENRRVRDVARDYIFDGAGR